MNLCSETGLVKRTNSLPRTSVDVPDASLVLEWVHGFSAQQARNNLHIRDGIVYFAAALGVVYDRKHIRNVFIMDTLMILYPWQFIQI